MDKKIEKETLESPTWLRDAQTERENMIKKK